jgi:hypothetical protein
MSGITRWRDLQNITTTEDQINLLAGLSVNASLLNQLNGFTGTGTTLNEAIANSASITLHIAKDLATAHSLLPNSIDGGVIANSTITKLKLAFNAMTDADYLVLSNLISSLEFQHNELGTQVQNLYGILFPSITGDIAEQFSNLIAHLEKTSNAHDASAISVGNQYVLPISINTGATQANISAVDIKWFNPGDTVEFQSTVAGPETRTITVVDYNGNQIAWSTPLIQAYSASNSSTVKNNSSANAQTSLNRSLRNSTDIFTGRLTINESSSNDALVINKTGTGYSTSFNDFLGKSALNYSFELGANNDSTNLKILDSQKRLGFQVTDQGNVLGTTYELSDRTTAFNGTLTKQSLTQSQIWKLPNRTGYVGIGDLTFTDLLKVKLIPGVKQLTVAPGYSINYDGEKIGAWIGMERASSYAGATIDIQAKFISDAQAVGLGSKWQIFNVYIKDNDTVHFYYGPQRTLRADAIAEYANFIPSAFMKLAMFIVQGDGLGGISLSSIEILEDQRPFLTMGMSAAYYDEVVLVGISGVAAGALVTLPSNSRAGGLLQTYKPGRGQLEVYIDGLYQEVGKDYEETQGEPIGRIRALKDIAPNSSIHFRVTYAAAAVTGGFEVPTLQSAYLAGPIISIAGLYGPVQMLSYDTDLLLDIAGSVNITNKIFNLKSLLFQKISTLVGDLDQNQLYVNSNSDLIYHQYKNNVAKDINILNEIDEAKTVVKIEMFNGTGILIPKGKALALHPSLPNAVILCDTSNSLSASRCIGLAAENIQVGTTGLVVISGQFKLTGLGIAHDTLLVVDPRNPGSIVSRSNVTYLPNDEEVQVGLVDGGHLLVKVVLVPRSSRAWKVGIAGEAFNANETKLVRFAIDGETRSRIYKADKANANLDQKFWVIGMVNPTININIGDSIDIHKSISLHSSEIAFDDQDIGKPLYLTSQGNFKPWRTLNGGFTLGDAAVKIGVIEDRRQFIVDGVQMMGTAPAANFY